MDAKHQRPLRAVAAIGDENNLPTKQSIHNGHKSAGNLKAKTTTGVLNAPPKRTAFGDVSNTVRGRVGDLAGKPVSKEAMKTRTKSTTAPLSTRDTRREDKENRQGGSNDSRSRTGAVSKGSKYNQVAPLQAANPAVRGTSLAQPPLRNGASKKTAIHQDRQEPKVNDRPAGDSPADDLAAMVVKPIKNPRQYRSQPLLRAEQQSIRHTHSRFAVKPDNLVEAESEADFDDNVTEAAYEDALEQLAQDVDGAVRDVLVEVEQGKYTSIYDEDYEKEIQSAEILDPSPAKTFVELSTAQELEEYWDEEIEQEYYEEQGYTTAHSLRSHGDNTTGGPTTMLAPSITASVEEELEMAKQYVLQHQNEDEVEDEAWDVSMVAEYGDEIFEYMRDLEAQMLPNPHYMDIQTEIQWSMRSVLMDWLVQVHHRFALLPETLFLTVNYIDRFLSVKVVSLGKLQLVGATALFVAAKYEEINCPSVQEIVYMVDSGYSVDEILKAERFMLSMLGFELGWPGPMSFLRRISKADDYDLDTRTLAKYFLEMTIMDERFVSSPPSYLAAGAHCISRLFLGKGDWSLAHVHYSGYTFSQLKPLVKMLYECCQYPSKHHGAVYDKYAGPKYKQSSTFVEGKIASGLTLSQLYDAAFSQPSTPSLLGDEIGRSFPASDNPVPIKA
ncbi:cyclin-like protein [Chaetomium strumarium]|uniref:Cyclin-like protein n=1 Tax=Chaetomium strumarium TaxID=1170767 RepID=A0AAJ0M4Q6_9PEZI|nr:cyclin-like protein [Chaetomium strumarium]